MDTSEAYIKMCDCPEIQKTPFATTVSKDWTAWLNGQPVWLPRQDQLQKMVGDSPYYSIKNAMWSVLDDFRNFAFATNFKEYIPLTMEQLWLAFVMKVEFSKVWDGEKWIK